MASITVSGSSAVKYDGRTLYPGATAFNVEDTLCNYKKAIKDVAAGNITITTPFNSVLSMDQQYLELEVDFSKTAFNSVATHEIFVVTGGVELTIIPECTSSLTSGGSATIGLGVEGATGAFIADTAFDLIDSDEIWDTAVDGTITKYGDVTAVGITKRVFGGLDIGFEIKTAALTGGKIVFHCFWKPLNSTGNIAISDGKALS